MCFYGGWVQGPRSDRSIPCIDMSWHTNSNSNAESHFVAVHAISISFTDISDRTAIIRAHSGAYNVSDTRIHRFTHARTVAN